MKMITWQFSYPKNPGFVSKAIKEKTTSEISHVDVITPDGKLLGAHADTGVQIREQNYMEFGLRIRVEVPVTDAQYDQFFQFMKSKVGEKYNQVGILGIVLNRDITQPGTEFCSQVQVEGVEAAHIFRVRKQPHMVSPEEFRLVISSRFDAWESRLDG